MDGRRGQRQIAVVGVAGGWSSERLADAAARACGQRRLIDARDLTLDLAGNRLRHPEFDLQALDALIIKKIGTAYAPEMIDRLDLLRFANERGLPVFSRPTHVARLVNRLSGTLSLRLAGIPMPQTIITERLTDALAAIRRWGRAVLKPLYTSKARGMTVVTEGDDAEELVQSFQAAGNPVIYAQEWIPDIERDLGVTFLGGEYLATYARTPGPGSWNTTTAGGGKYRSHEPGDEIIALARRAQALFELDFTCVDVVETPHGPRVFEVSAFGGFRGLLEANGIDAAPLYVDYVLRRLGAAEGVAR
ncbi:MAG: Ribosomal protein S6--L-glutamate ligase [Phycisphaerae bacterium]|nr:Ribosomal protein S6--L-glutamate ligase [Phycisphaerae bacterium]